MSSHFIYNLLSPISAAHMHMCMAFSSGMQANRLSLQKKKECPFVSTNQVTFISATRTGVFAVPSYSLLKSLTGLILCGSCVGNLRCYEIMFETTLSFLENSIYRIFPHTLHLTFSQKFPES